MLESQIRHITPTAIPVALLSVLAASALAITTVVHPTEANSSIAAPRAPVIVAQVALSDQTGAIPVSTLVTPRSSGLFRVSGSVIGLAGCNSTAPAEVALIWTDDRGAEQGQLFNPGVLESSAYGLSSVVRVIAGTPLSYEIPSGDVNCTPYDLFLTVEQLQ